ncbi:MAG: hypothetical protein ACYCVH_14615 [Ignavibacteriaceae bacterium]
MRTIYLRIDENNFTRKVLIDMAYLVSHKKIRLPKYYHEENLYLPYTQTSNGDGLVEKYFLTKDKIISEDADFFYFKFIFKPEQVMDAAD